MGRKQNPILLRTIDDPTPVSMDDLDPKACWYWAGTTFKITAATTRRRFLERATIPKRARIPPTQLKMQVVWCPIIKRQVSPVRYLWNRLNGPTDKHLLPGALCFPLMPDPLELSFRLCCINPYHRTTAITKAIGGVPIDKKDKIAELQPQPDFDAPPTFDEIRNEVLIFATKMEMRPDIETLINHFRDEWKLSIATLAPVLDHTTESLDLPTLWRSAWKQFRATLNPNP